MQMPNNLDAMITRSGMSKREVAALKGITPETLSRQIHGKIQMTLQDAEYYGKILNCAAQDVLFATPPIPIIGYCHLKPCDPDHARCSPHGVHVESEVSAGKRMGKVYLQTYFPVDTGAILWSADKGFSGMWQQWKDAVDFVELMPISENFVSENAVQHQSYVLLQEPDEIYGSLVVGILYPEPGGLYTIHNEDVGFTIKGQKVIWASAVLAAFFRPSLRGMEIILDK